MVTVPNLDQLVAGPATVDRSCYIDPAIFALEQQRIFEKTWSFIAHESELVKAGDFRTTDLAGQPVIAVRGDDGQIRVFYNSCRHKGTMVIAEKEGNLPRLRCPYHHWTYRLSGDLISVPRIEGYGPNFRLADNGLAQLPRVEMFMGMIFANLDADAPDFETYLGPAKPYLANVAHYSGEELVSIGSYRYSYPANWKLLMENTLDDYHAEYLHDYAFAQRADLFDMKGTSGFQEEEGARFSVELDIHGAYDQTDDARTLKIQKARPRRVYIGVFPGFIALYHPLWDVTGLRIIEPVSVNETNVLTYCLAPKSATVEQRKAIGERFHYSWGPGGRAGVDDLVMFGRIQKGLQAKGVGPVLINRGMHRPDPQGGPADDHAVRGFWNGWRRYMTDELPGAGKPSSNSNGED